jgi:hypothetical protein
MHRPGVECTNTRVKPVALCTDHPVMAIPSPSAGTPRGARAPAKHAPAVMPLLALAVALLLALAGVGTTGASAAEPGVNLRAPNAAQIADMTALGTHWVRLFANWPDLEPSRGGFSASQLAYYEGVFAALPAGTKVIVDMVDTPSWESGSSDPHAPPNPTAFAAFVGTLAARWAGHVTAWEIWNEEDASRWWSGAPNPTAYVRLLQATYPVVKAAEPGATVVLGGLTGNDYEFLEGVYQAGGKGFFDAVGVHTDTACDVLSPYEFLRGPNNRMIDDSFLAYREVHATMLANGDSKPIWMTETSWRTTEAVCSEGAFAGQKPEGVTPAQQALYLSQAYHCLAQDPYVQVALWFPLRDERGLMNGLVRSNGARKPAFASMRSYARDGDRLTGPCGVLIGPAISVLSPVNNVHYSGPLPIHVLASSSQGIFRITLKIDGKLIRNYGGSTYPTKLSGYLDWQGARHISLGRHTLTFLAYDRERNVSEASLTIFHGGGGRGVTGHRKSKRRRRSRRHYHHARRH